MGKEVIPRSKMDYDSIEKLKKMPYTDLEPIQEELLVWVQDYNWPIAPEICEMLIPLNEKLVPSIKKILSGTDETWIDNCIRFIVEHLSVEAIEALRPELERIAYTPSEDEEDLGTNIVTKQILDRVSRQKF
jgi:hypothetical protein